MTEQLKLRTCIEIVRSRPCRRYSNSRRRQRNYRRVQYTPTADRMENHTIKRGGSAMHYTGLNSGNNKVSLEMYLYQYFLNELPELCVEWVQTHISKDYTWHWHKSTFQFCLFYSPFIFIACTHFNAIFLPGLSNILYNLANVPLDSR
jgi:hypothetical protein